MAQSEGSTTEQKHHINRGQSLNPATVYCTTHIRMNNYATRFSLYKDQSRKIVINNVFPLR